LNERFLKQFQPDGLPRPFALGVLAKPLYKRYGAIGAGFIENKAAPNESRVRCKAGI